MNTCGRLSLLIALLLALVPSVASQSIDQSPGALTCRFPLERPPGFLSSAAPARADTLQYSGTVGNQPVTMVLRRSDADLSGVYFYEQFRAPIQVRGRVTDGGFTLTEFGDVRAPEKSTGSFEGSGNLSNVMLDGTWRAPDGARQRRFALTRPTRQIDRQILFTWERPSTTRSVEGWKAEVDYSPASHELLYLEAPDVIGALSVVTMKARTVLKFTSSIGQLVFSHAGDRVAFSAGPRESQDIYVMGTTDASPLRLTDALTDHVKDPPFFYSYLQPRFSPDDRTVLFQQFHGPDPNNRVAVVSSASGPVHVLGEGYAEMAYWSADGTRICSYSDVRTSRKIVYAFPSGTASVGSLSSYDRDKERACRTIADAASSATCDVPAGNGDFETDRLYRGAGERLSQRWVSPEIVINRYEFVENGRPGSRIQVVRLVR